MLSLLRRILGVSPDPNGGGWDAAGKGRARNFDKTRPPGTVEYLHTSVMGTYHRLDDAYRIASGDNLRLRLEREEGNRHDRNALKIVASSTHGTAHIGYVGKEQASQIVRSGLLVSLSVLVDRVYIAHDKVDIRVLIVGPADLQPRFDATAKTAGKRGR